MPGLCSRSDPKAAAGSGVLSALRQGGAGWFSSAHCETEQRNVKRGLVTQEASPRRTTHPASRPVREDLLGETALPRTAPLGVEELVSKSGKSPRSPALSSFKQHRRDNSWDRSSGLRQQARLAPFPGPRSPSVGVFRGEGPGLWSKAASRAALPVRTAQHSCHCCPEPPGLQRHSQERGLHPPDGLILCRQMKQL